MAGGGRRHRTGARRHALAGAGALSLLAVACAATTLAETWRNPRAEPTRFRKVLAVAMVKDPELRRRAEDEIISHLRSDDALPTRAVIPDAELGDVERAKARLRAAGFDGAVVLRPVAVEERIRYTSAYIAESYDSFWGYYGYGWAEAWEPGPTRIDTHLRIETLIYSVERDQLLWTGVTRTINPESVRVTISEIAAEVTEALRREGLMPSAADRGRSVPRGQSKYERPLFARRAVSSSHRAARATRRAPVRAGAPRPRRGARAD